MKPKRSDEKIEKIIAAHRAGHTHADVEDAVRVHLSRKYDCESFSGVSRGVLRKRRILIRDGVLDPVLLKPSDIASRRASELLQHLESHISDTLYCGTPPDTWAAVATWVDGYVSRSDIPIEEVSTQFNVSAKTIRDRAPQIVTSHAFDRFYGNRIPLPAHLDRLLAEWRVSPGMLGVRIVEAETSAHRRLRAVESNSDKQVVVEEFSGKEFHYVKTESA